MKTYVLTLSKAFPATHPRKGEPTGFRDKFLAAIKQLEGGWSKLHTIRANYTLWEKRIAEIQRGEAVLSVRQWAGKPYASKQELIANLTKDDGVGIQWLTLLDILDDDFCLICSKPFKNLKLLAKNDGLSFEDWQQWFKNYDKTKTMAIIHFTKFRY